MKVLLQDQIYTDIRKAIGAYINIKKAIGALTIHRDDFIQFDY